MGWADGVAQAWSRTIRQVWLWLLLVAWPLADAASTAESAGRLLTYQEWTAPGGMKVLLVQDPGLDRVELTVHVPFGSFHEPRELGGLAHLREHLVGYASSPGDEAFIPWVKRQPQGEHWFKTRDQDTVYFAAVESAQGAALVDRLRRALQPRAYPAEEVRQQIDEVEREWRQFQGQDAQILEQLESFAAAPAHPVARFRSGGVSSLPLSRADELAWKAQQMTAAQHKACALSWVFVSPLSLVAMKQAFEQGLQARLALPGAARRCEARGRALVYPRPVWQSAWADRVSVVDGFEEEEELWVVLASTEARSRDAGAFWVSQIEGGQSSSLRRQLQARGWVQDLSAHFDARYFGSADRWWLKLHLTDAGRAQVPAVRRLIEAWWHQEWPDAGKALRRFETMASEGRRWSPAPSRAPWGFQLATALSRCSGVAVFQGCGPAARRQIRDPFLVSLRSHELTAWRVPHDRGRRLAWLERWRQQAPRTHSWPTGAPEQPVSGTSAAHPVLRTVAAPRAVMSPAQAVAEWRQQGWDVCAHAGDAREPFVATVKARLDLTPLSDVERVRILLALEGRRGRDGVLGAVSDGHQQRLDWQLQGATVELVARGRRDWQAGLMRDWLDRIGQVADVQVRTDEAMKALRTRARDSAKDPVFDALVAQMARDAGQSTSGLGAWLKAWDQAQAVDPGSVFADELPPMPVRLWVADGSPRVVSQVACEARASVERVPWQETGSLARVVELPAGSNVSALLLRCGPHDATRFWMTRQSRAVLRYQLRTLAREQGLEIPFISVAAFPVPQGTCWGAFAEAAPDAVPDLADTLQRLMVLRASMFRQGSGAGGGRLDWRLKNPSCQGDVEGWSQVWSLGWPAALGRCPVPGPDGEASEVQAGEETPETWLARDWAPGQAWRVYRGVPAVNADQ